MVIFKIKTPSKTKRFNKKTYIFQGTVKTGRELDQRKKLLKQRGRKVRSIKFKKNVSSVYIL